MTFISLSEAKNLYFMSGISRITMKTEHESDRHSVQTSPEGPSKY